MPAFKTAFRKSYLFDIARNIYVHSKAFTENKNNKIYLYITQTPQPAKNQTSFSDDTSYHVFIVFVFIRYVWFNRV